MESNDAFLKTGGNKYLSPDHLSVLNKRHFYGSWIRSGAAAFMWLFALAGYISHTLGVKTFWGITFTVFFMIGMNIPVLVILGHISRKRTYTLFSLFINFLEIISYTTIIFFLGGTRAGHMTLMYAAVIAYIGVVSLRKKLVFVVSGLCLFSFDMMAALEYLGIIDITSFTHNIKIQWSTEVLNVFIINGLIIVITFIISYTVSLLEKNRKAFRRKNQELLEATSDLKKKNADLKDTMKSLEKANKAKSEFFANMSHELRTPLNHIIGFTEMIVDKRCGELNETQKEYLNNALESSHHLLSLIKKLLNTSVSPPDTKGG